MAENGTLKPAGYAALVERYHLDIIPHWHRSLITTATTHKKETIGGMVEETYPLRYWPGDTLGDHMEFALKYDGMNLAILSSLFQVAAEDDILIYIKSSPTGKYVRQVWYLYELLIGRRLPLDDLKQGNYIDLLDAEHYYTTTTPQRIRRQRINYNLLGDVHFCPIVRRTEHLRRFEAADLPAKCRAVISRYSPELLKRAMSYLYTKETKSSFEIEHIKSDSNRTDRFVALLRSAESRDFCEKPQLIELQNRIVDPRFRDPDYRKTQNYIGETISRQKERIHYVSPKPDDLPGLMDGLIAAHKRMSAGGVSAVVHAATVAYGFVFLHPFEDGNGRIHRFLIHNILARRGFTPEGIIFPVSASMLKDPAAYDASLEAFSRPLMSLVTYSLDDDGHMTVHNDTAERYRYLDMTSQVEVLFRFIEQTIETELVEELTFLVNYDQTKKALQEIVDMPDRQTDLFIRVCLQNHGRLSAQKRAAHFEFLSDEEISRMEQAIQSAYGKS